LHITIFFLGEVLEENIPPISDSISSVTNNTKSFQLEFEKIKLAGKLKHGGMIWAQFYKNDFYFNLSTGIYHAVKSFLLTQPVLKDPVPHITLARFRKEADFNQINLSFENSFTLPEINFCELWKTIQTKEGVQYKSLERFEFGK
jgi:2'-5' RNA ligase